MRKTGLALAGAVFLFGCSPGGGDADFNTDMDVLEIMIHVIDPAARAFWDGWGFTFDEEGLHDVSASTDEEWKRVEDGAATVVTGMNVIMLPAHQRAPAADWNSYAREVAALAMEGKDAAEAQNLEVMEELGQRLNEACRACHEAFVPEPGE